MSQSLALIGGVSLTLTDRSHGINRYEQESYNADSELAGFGMIDRSHRTQRYGRGSLDINRGDLRCWKSTLFYFRTIGHTADRRTTQ